MRIITAFALAAGLSACAMANLEPTSSLSVAAKTCTDQQSRFVDAWGCIQAKNLLGELGEPSPKLAGFVKSGDELASQVTAKHLSEAVAKKRLLENAAAADKG